MIRVGFGKDFMMIDRINEEPKEYIILKGKKEIKELFNQLSYIMIEYMEKD